jgi:hypothetical protein
MLIFRGKRPSWPDRKDNQIVRGATMPRKPYGLPRLDHQCLLKCVSTYKKLSPTHCAELSAHILKHGWKSGAIHASRRLQQISLGLQSDEVTPSELKETVCGGLKKLWFIDPRDPRGTDSRRPEMCMILRGLQFHRLSRYEPRPEQAILAAEARRMHMQDSPSGDAA